MPTSFVGLLNTSPFFATRPFLATFLIALVARFTHVLDAPNWFLTDIALMVMGGLALIEIFGTKTDLGRLLDEFTPLAKGILNFLLVLILVLPAGVGSSGESLAPQNLLPQILAATDDWQMLGMAAVWPILSGVSVWILSFLRSGILSALVDLDEDDDLGVQGFFSWIEDIWTISGTLVALFFPLIALTLYGLTLLGLFLTQRYVNYLQEKRKIGCHTCGTPIFATALYCPTCTEPNMTPLAVGLLGQARDQLAVDPHVHHHQLITRKRCPICATRLPERSVQQACIACGTATFTDYDAVDRYLRQLRAELPKKLAIAFGLSFVPILGILPGMIYYRLAFVSSMRGYVQRRVVFLVRWMLILFNLLLISIQWIPFIGALAIPIICLTNYWVYQRLLRRAARQKFDSRQSSSQTSEVSYAT